MIRTATITGDGRYRYDLGRQWGDPDVDGLALWVMLNPSTANATEDDATIRRVRKFTERAGYGGFVVVNLFALRARNPNRLLEVDDPAGPDNVSTVRGWITDERVRVLVPAWGAWGAHSKLPESRVRGLVEAQAHPSTDLPVMSLGVTATGEPCHPLYLSGSTEFEPWPRDGR